MIALGLGASLTLALVACAGAGPAGLVALLVGLFALGGLCAGCGDLTTRGDSGDPQPGGSTATPEPTPVVPLPGDCDADTHCESGLICGVDNAEQ